MANIVIYGTGDVALLAHYFLSNDSPHDVRGFCLERDRMRGTSVLDLPLVPFEVVNETFPPTEFQMMIAVGFQRVNRVRAEKYEEAKAKGYSLTSYVSSSAITWPDLSIGENCIVMEGNVIQPFAQLGNNVILGPKNSIGHHVRIKDHAFLASCVDLSGRVTIESYCFLGANATVRDGITVRESSVIGANAIVHRDTKAQDVYVSPRAVLLPLRSDRLPWLTSLPEAIAR